MLHVRYCMTVAAIALASACAADDGNSLQILGVPVPSDECIIETDVDVTYSSGFYDPRGFLGSTPGAFLLGLIVRNNMREEGDSRNVPELRPNATDVTMVGFESCWMEGAVEVDSNDCSDFPSDQETETASAGLVAAGGGLQAFGVPILSLEQLRTMFGDDFTPAAIPDLGNYTAGRYSYNSQDPSDVATRDPAWGDYPTTRDSNVLIRTRAIGRLQDGKLVHSNFFDFVVSVCVGCSAGICGDAMISGCGNTGLAPDVAEGCLPFQSGECADFTTCP
jgi:hypothetical protein